MDRVRFIEHRGTEILLSDLSDIRSTEELHRVVRLGSELAQTQPLNSLRILVDVTNVEYSLEAFAIVQRAVAVNRPYVRARAIVGLAKAAMVPFQIVAKLAASPMASFREREPAMDWLISV